MTMHQLLHRCEARLRQDITFTWLARLAGEVDALSQ
jgi:hypothetical protein